MAGGYAGEVRHEPASSADGLPRPRHDQGAHRTRVVHDRSEPERGRRERRAQNRDGMYVKAEYSQARGDHWRTTIAMAYLGGQADDFLGQYRRNSHVVLSLRYSF